MRRLALTFVFLLASCGYSAYLKFDSQEYQNFIEVKSEADVARTYCSTDPTRALEVALLALPYKTAVAENYVLARGTTEVHGAAKILRELVEELRSAYTKGTVSRAYCEIKYGNISAAAARIATTLGKKE